MNPTLFSLISAVTALIATVVGPYVSIKTTRSHINASVLASNRAKWIETMRDLIAGSVAQMTAYMVLRAHLSETELANQEASSELLGRIERGAHTISMIRLMVNPNEPDSQKLLTTLETALHCLRSPGLQVDLEKQIQTYCDEIVHQGQMILKREWIRVKQLN